MSALAKWLGQVIGEAIKPIIMECLKEYFKSTGEVAKPNEELQNVWDSGSPDNGSVPEWLSGQGDEIHLPEAGDGSGKHEGDEDDSGSTGKKEG